MKKILKTALALVLSLAMLLMAFACTPTSKSKADSISLDKDTLALYIGDSAQLNAEVLDVDGEPVTDEEITWTSSDSAIVTVTNGLIEAKAKGSATITAKVGKVEATCEVTVSEKILVDSITLSEETAELVLGQATTLGRIQLSATVLPVNAFDKTYTWASSNTEVATVSATGLVQAVSVGTVTITATANDASGVADSCEITVTAPVTGVTLNQTSLKVNVGANTITLQATVNPSMATNKNVTWSSDNAQVASVDNGVVTFGTTGNATITVTTAEGSFTATCLVTVANSATVTTETEFNTALADNSITEIVIGTGDRTLALTSTLTFSRSVIIDGIFTSSSNRIITVNEGAVVEIINGRILTTGTATLTLNGAGTLIVRGLDVVTTNNDTRAIWSYGALTISQITLISYKNIISRTASAYTNCTITINNSANVTVYGHPELTTTDTDNHNGNGIHGNTVNISGGAVVSVYNACKTNGTGAGHGGKVGLQGESGFTVDGATVLVDALEGNGLYESAIWCNNNITFTNNAVFKLRAQLAVFGIYSGTGSSNIRTIAFTSVGAGSYGITTAENSRVVTVNTLNAVNATGTPASADITWSIAGGVWFDRGSGTGWPATPPSTAPFNP